MAGLNGKRRSRILCVVRATGVLLLVCLSAVTSQLQAEEVSAQDFPKYSVFSAAINDYFARKPGYRPGNIVSQSDVHGVFRSLESMGWTVSDQKKILGLVLPDSDYMVTQLRTKRGRVFMADLSKTPEAYDRLERFLRLPLSKRQFEGLLDGPDGYKMFNYMVTARGGKVLGLQLSNTKDGRDFNKPTGHIYTEDQLVKRLAESHADFVAALKQQADEGQ